MKRTTALLGLAVLTVLLILAATPMPVAADVSKGDKAPNFTLPSVTGSSKVALANYAGKPTLLVFWVSWCPHCQREVPVLDKIYKDLKPKGMNAVGVSVDQTASAARDFVAQRKVSFSNAYAGGDDGQAVTDMYGVQGVPAVYILDKTGKVANVFVGETDAATIRGAFAKLGVK